MTTEQKHAALKMIDDAKAAALGAVEMLRGEVEVDLHLPLSDLRIAIRFLELARGVVAGAAA